MKDTIPEVKEIDLLGYIQSIKTSKIKKLNNNTYRINPCPICGHNDDFTIYQNTNSYTSFNGCSKGGSIIDFYMDYHKVDKSSAITALKKYAKIEENNNKIEYKKTVQKPTKIADFTDLVNELAENETDYFINRGLSEKIISKYKLGYHKDGFNYAIKKLDGILEEKENYIMKSYKYFLPIWDNDNKCRYFITRLDDTVNLSVKPQKTHNLKGFNIRLFNDYILNKISDNKHIFITEGIFDALSLEEFDYESIALNSVSNANKLVTLIKENISNLSNKTFILVPDNDNAGIQLKENLLTQFRLLNLKLEIFNFNNKYKDINEYLITDKIALQKELNIFIKNITKEKKEENKMNNILNIEEKLKDKKMTWIIQEMSEKGKIKTIILTSILAEYIRENEKYIFVKNNANDGIMRFWYTEGYYKLVSDDEIKGFIKKLIPFEFQKTKDINEVFNLLITDLNFVPSEKLNSNENIINFKNGLLYLDTMKLKKHTPEELCTIQISCNYIENVITPKTKYFDNFINHLTKNDEGIKSLLLQFLGVVISNIKGWRLKKSLFMVGEGDTGKSQLKELATKLVGNSNCTGIDLTELEARFGTSELFNKRLAGSSDMSYATVNEMKVFKKATGGDTLNGEFKGKNKFNFIYNGLLWFCCNELPKFGGDKGDHVYNRIIVVECNNPVPKKDKLLQDKMYTERDYIVNLAIKELQKVIKNDYEFIIPSHVEESIKKYKISNNSFLQFMDECTVERKNGIINDNCTAKIFYDVYVAWCKDNFNGNHEQKKDIKNILEKMGKNKTKPKNGYESYIYFTLSTQTKKDYAKFYGFDSISKNYEESFNWEKDSQEN